MTTRPLTVLIYLFDEIEVLDFAGPFEVLSLAMKEEQPFFRVKTISETGKSVRARNGLTVVPDYGFDTWDDKADIVIIPGGHGARETEIHKKNVLEWIQTVYQETTILASVCTGSFLLAEAGLLTGKEATTHWASLERFKQTYPTVQVKQQVKFVDQGDIITSAGISAGINMSFHLVKKLVGLEQAKSVAKRMEYDIEM
ncbi:DJ-1/PfpI family protein [Alkalicoccobacillus murimartini]|uniref:Transcriptional regulator GlxA family with amidase domain n=1 Tax=Alkalicoccobacillus murimartini TaxID=171685 RepID=A0ABT9YDU9_9BACI|nr:DJ-1/PfpI family protein [Alkalicoccobacillus murimartini]MDQ0206012.1 transcriptional regulator GlxA family with amidase domain [Alkalicoccobacillus murimartini]